MKMKKFVSAALAGAMALSLSVPAFAASTEVSDITEPVEVEVTGDTKVPAVKILVPSGGSVILNPYRLEVEVDEAIDASKKASDQVMSAVSYVVNQSDLKVKVSTSVTGTIEGAEFATATVDAAETEKKVFLEFNYAKAAIADGATDPTAPTSWTKKTVGTDPVEIKGTDAIELGAKSAAATVEKALGYKFTGDATANPTTAWTADDIVGATIAFTFELVANDAATGGGGAA